MATIEIYRHARAYRGDPRLASSPKENVDPATKPGHDEN
jgi:hypothetical protein